MKFNIRDKIFETCFELKNYFIVQNIDDFFVGDFIVGYGRVNSNSYITNKGWKEYYLVSKKSLQVFASFQGFNVCKNGYIGNLKYGKAKWVIAKIV
jgi:hypothetical protein